MAEQPDLSSMTEEACSSARRAHMMGRAALIIACMALAVAILGLFLPIE
jgi:hypothetical protein